MVHAGVVGVHLPLIWIMRSLSLLWGLLVQSRHVGSQIIALLNGVLRSVIEGEEPHRVTPQEASVAPTRGLF